MRVDFTQRHVSCDLFSRIKQFVTSKLSCAAGFSLLEDITYIAKRRNNKELTNLCISPQIIQQQSIHCLIFNMNIKNVQNKIPKYSECAIIRSAHYHVNFTCYHVNFTCYHVNFTCYHVNFTCDRINFTSISGGSQYIFIS